MTAFNLPDHDVRPTFYRFAFWLFIDLLSSGGLSTAGAAALLYRTAAKQAKCSGEMKCISCTERLVSADKPLNNRQPQAGSRCLALAKTGDALREL